MSFEYDLDDISKKFNIRKDIVKRKLKAFPFVDGVDYRIETINKLEIKKRGGHNKECIKLTKIAYDQLITSFALSIKSVNSNITEIKIDYIKRYLPHESEIIDFIFETLTPMFMVCKQYPVLTYRIDLYIVQKSIAIECDEFDHKDRDQSYEKKREIDIIREKKCKFIRFNPNSKDFKLSSLMSTIISYCFMTDVNLF